MIRAIPDAQPVAPLIREFFGIRYAETSPTVTSGSLLDLPRDDGGTVAWGTGTNATVIYPEANLDTALSFTGPVFAYPRRSYARTMDSRPVDLEMSQLEVAAQIGDEHAFITAYQHMDWQQRSAEDFLRGVQLALAAGAHLAARNLSALGAIRFPDREDLQKYARVLAPSKVTRTKQLTSSNWKANRDWLVEHGAFYRGQWVALRDGNLVASADTLKDLSHRISSKAGLLITKVY